MTDTEIQQERNKVRDRLEMMEGFWQYLITDSPIVFHNPNLSSKSYIIGQYITDLKNHIPK